MPVSNEVAPFPGRVVAAGSADKASVLVVQKRLNELGLGPVAEDGAFGPETMEAVELFQARSVDGRGQPLEVDGRVGPMTWAALFRVATAAATEAKTPLATEVLNVARAEIGVREQPEGSNTGPEVNQFLASVGAAPGNAWCAAFVYWCLSKAAANVGERNPGIRTAGALDLWNQAGAKGVKRVACAEAADRPALVEPGMVFVISTGGGHGHVGFVESVEGVVLTTIEGNTNDGGSREGVGVFRHTGRRIAQINRGFVDFGERG